MKPEVREEWEKFQDELARVRAKLSAGERDDFGAFLVEQRRIAGIWCVVSIALALLTVVVLAVWL